MCGHVTRYSASHYGFPSRALSKGRKSVASQDGQGMSRNAVKNCVTLNFSSYFNFLSKTSITPDLVNVIKQNLIC